MRFIEPEIEEEGFVAIAFLIEPGKSLINHDLTGIAFNGSNSPSIAQKVGGVLVTGSNAVDDTEPIVKAVIGRRGVLTVLDGHAEVPLAKVSSGIAVFLEHFGDRRFTLQ